MRFEFLGCRIRIEFRGFAFPIFHYSMCEEEAQALENPFILSKLYKFRDVKP
jgi:hypothetical protein